MGVTMFRQKSYPIYESMLCAFLVTFISGFVNAFTYLTQGGRFAGVQTGNLLMMGIRLAEGRLLEAIKFLIPIVVFMTGQVMTYFFKSWALKNHFHWHLLSSLILTSLNIIAILGLRLLHPYIIVGILSLFMSLQVDTFKSIRGTSFATVMMTGNIKNAAYYWVKGFIEKDMKLRKDGRNILFILVTFSLGAMCATFLSIRLGELALIFSLFPLLFLNFYLMIGAKKGPQYNSRNILKKR
ncbi:membrane protein [Streptococcus agalactiae LMG 14747]|uniref:Membrane protein n=3 Tax=Streptococcus TaxID=1301 RepID=V6YZ30_STRAG|nr:membrane protein [Streptococcus agalactiae LMG 14747]SNV44664.1 membrane protein [Streptococcus acidominimus]